METVKLTNVEGFARLSGTDQHSNLWVQFEVDPFTTNGLDMVNGDDNFSLDYEFEETCPECGTAMTSGWLCMDGGESLCNDHVEIINRA
jgi:hypothetical protein